MVIPKHSYSQIKRTNFELVQRLLLIKSVKTELVEVVTGMNIVSASRDHTARIWNTTTNQCEAELKEHWNRVTSAVFSPDGVHIVSASHDHTARIWNTATGECEAELIGHCYDFDRFRLYSRDWTQSVSDNAQASVQGAS